MDVRFGEFEFSLDSLKLRRAGADVRLVGQPLHLLVMLLQTPGKVVTREEIRQRLWPDTHVDFDHGLNVALNRLRVALGDKGKQSRFIETVPTMGYRFLAPVEVLVPAGAAPDPPRSSARRRVAWFVLNCDCRCVAGIGDRAPALRQVRSAIRPARAVRVVGRFQTSHGQHG